MKHCRLTDCDAGYCCEFCEFTSKRKTLRNCPVQNDGLRGLGDLIAAATRFLKLKKCGGCSERQKKLNDLTR